MYGGHRSSEVLEVAGESLAHAMQLYSLTFFLDFVVCVLTAFPTLFVIGVQLCNVRLQRAAARFFSRHFWFDASSSYHRICNGYGHVGFFFDGLFLLVGPSVKVVG